MSDRPNEVMLEVWVDGEYRWLVHRKVHAPGQVDQPDPKKWYDPATGEAVILRHGETHFCDDCPPEKHHVQARVRAYCPPGQRCFGDG